MVQKRLTPVAHLIARLSKKHLAHHNELADAVNALQEEITIQLVISAQEPTEAIGFWLRLTDNTNSYQLYARENVSDSWTPASAGIGADGDSFGDLSPRQVGQFVGDPDNGDYIGLESDAQSARLVANRNGGRICAFIEAHPDRVLLRWSGATSASIQLDAEGVKFNNVPTTDPALLDPSLIDVLWNDNGVLRLSVLPEPE